VHAPYLTQPRRHHQAFAAFVGAPQPQGLTAWIARGEVVLRLCSHSVGGQCVENRLLLPEQAKHMVKSMLAGVDTSDEEAVE
jgi:hypothetical protein